MRKISSYLNVSLKPSLDKFILLSLIFLLIWFIYPKSTVIASSTDNVSGFAWSETVGWISFNCIDTASCASSNYGVNIDFATGNLSGYAWSEHVGWISFERATTNNPPQAPYNIATGPIARYSSSTGMLEGWARALSGCENTPGTPLSPCPQTAAGGASGGFDGWIKLSGTASNGSPYGISVSSTGDASGFAWGSEVVGWVDFSLVNITMPGDPSVILEVNPNPVPSVPSSVALTWTVANVTSCTASNDGGVANWASGKNNNDGVHDETVTVNSTPVTFELDCVGIDDEHYTDSVTVNTAGVPSVSLTALPSTVNSGDTTVLNWATESMVSCTASDAWSGSKPVNANYSEPTSPIMTDSTFTLNCVGTDGLNYSGSVLVTVNSASPVPSGTISAGNCTISAGNSNCNSTVDWTTSSVIDPKVYQGSNQFSTVPSGSQNRIVNYGSDTFTLYDGGSVLDSVTVSADCGSLTWNGSTCEATTPPLPPPTLNSLSITANPNIIRSGRSTELKISIDSPLNLTCALSGGVSGSASSFVHNGTTDPSQEHIRTTDVLYSTQLVKVDCWQMPGNSLADDETRITVIPTVQEI